MDTTHILLVEDDAPARMLLTNILLNSGYRVTSAPDGETAIEQLTQSTSKGKPFDIVLSDICMGGIDGIEVLHVARSQNPPPAVILLTGFASLDTVVAALRDGACDYLQKPCSPAELLSRIASVADQRAHERQHHDAMHTLIRGFIQMQGHSHEPADQPVPKQRAKPATNSMPRARMSPDRSAPPVVQVGLLRLDMVRRQAYFADHLLQLTPTEFALLECLATTPGQMIEYRVLVRHTHGYEADDAQAQALLKVHVRNLRRKLSPSYLITVRGAGYRLAITEEGGAIP